MAFFRRGREPAEPGPEWALPMSAAETADFVEAVRSLGIVESINKLILTALALFEEGPGSISPWIYWWREGSVTLLPSEVTADSVQFVPPDEFVEVLNALPAA